MTDTQTIQVSEWQRVTSASKGDSTAFRAIVEEHQAMVYRTCLRILRNAADAEDATQAVFIVCHKKLPQLAQGTVLGGWLYRAAELVCREFVRSSRRQKRREQEAAAMKETTVNDTNEIWNAMQPELDAALMALPQQYRNVVVLRYLEGKSTNETAAVMGLSESAVTTRLSRAIEQLRASFGRRGVVLGSGVLAGVLAENANAAIVPAHVAPAALATTGVGTMANSANASLMAKGALAKMGTIAWHLWNVIGLIIWIDCMVSWIRDGCQIPRWVHVLALSLFVAGLITLIVMGMTGPLTLTMVALCLLAPPAGMYVGWLWMYGPAFAKSDE